MSTAWIGIWIEARTIIGTSAAGLLDLRSSPLDKLFAGVEFHVEALEQILQGPILSGGSVDQWPDDVR